MYTKEDIQSLSPDEKRAALGRLLQDRRIQSQSAYRLSSAQESMWFQQQLEPDSSAYNLPLIFCVKGELRSEMLQQCLNAIIERHQTLRTVFRSENGIPVQSVLPSLFVDLPTRNLNVTDGRDWKTEVLKLSSEQSRQPINLATGPLMRAQLVRVSETIHVLLLTLPHIVMDGWSIGVLLREFADIYLSIATGRQPSLSPLRAQYRDFVHWQMKKLEGENINGQIAYWKQRVAGAPLALELPADFPRSTNQSYLGASYRFFIPSALSEKLKSLSRRSGATLFMTMLASYYVLLARLSGQEDIVVGTPIANRQRQEFSDLIGLFANTVPMRGDLSGDPTFLEFLSRVRLQAADDYSQTDVPLARLVEEINPARDPTRNPLFQAGFVFQNWPWPDNVGDRVTLIDGDHGAAQLDLFLSISVNAKGMSGALEYATELFTAETISNLADCFQQLLESIVANPEKRVSNFSLLSATKRRQILTDWNQTQARFPDDSSIHQLFEAQARLSPDRYALIHGGARWSYRELDQAANRLARQLRRAGVELESKVAFCAERSPEAIAGLLAILKAGGCYVPLDPELPLERLAYITADAGVSVLLTTRRLAALIPNTSISTVYLDSSDEGIGPEGPELPWHGPAPQNLAYLIYTSGSTGKPKGVAVTHAALVNHTCSAGLRFGLGSEDRVLQFASLSFDTSAEEIFPCLTHGATLVLRTDEMLSSPASFLEACRLWEVTVLDLPTAYWHELAATVCSDGAAIPESLRLLIIGGEAASPEMVARWLDSSANRVRLLNTYGPTEATIVATTCDLSDQAPQYVGRAPIGQPIHNVQAYVVDPFLNPVPPGLPGEILLGGAGIARGYLNRPELTAEKFIPDPFSSTPGARLYRTGDLGRYLPGGVLEFKGRVDSQIKLRGFRIELGELETTLQEHPAVDQVVVLVRESRSGDRRLAAFVILKTSFSVPVSELRAWLRQRLPDYMVPATFTILEALPLTVNGKVDRKALLALAPETVELARTVTAPRTPAEELMAGIWSEVLGVERVGIYDNFFELGGHSLLATRVLSRLRKLMQVDVPLHTLFEAPTVARFAEVVEARRWQDNGMAPPPLVRLPRDHANANTFVQSLAQQRLWFLDQLQPNRSTYNMFNAVRMEGDLDLSALEASLNELIRRHEILRTTFHKGDMSPVQVVAGELRISVPLVDLTGLPKDEQDPTVRSLAEAEAQRPFDLAQGPLLRMRVLRLAADEHVLFFAMHHIVSDGWSIGVLVQEMAALYPAFRAGEPSPLRDLDFQYADFSEWQRSWLSGEPLERQLTYWRNQLKAAPAFLPLPTDQNEAPTRSGAGSNVSRRFDKPLVDSIQRFTRAENVTPFMTLLAAFQALLYRYTNQTDILVGTPIADRRREEIEPLIGFFVNTLVMRADLTGNPSFRHLVARVRETALDAYAYQDVPFDRLVEELRPQRQAGMTPLFRVMFALQNAPLPHLALPGLHVTPIEFAGRSAQFDLTLEIVEDADGMIARFEFSTDLFDEATVQRMLEHYQQLLTGALAQPDQRLSDLPLLTAPEFDQLVYGFNELKRLPPPAEPIHALFEQQVDRTPDRIAAVDGYIQISYAELEARANRLAHYLIGCGVGPEMCVGICIPRSVSMIIAVLGVLKAGAAYLPLDPAYPAERLSFMLADGAVSVLLAERSVLNILPPHSARTVLIDTDWPSISICSASRPLSPVSPQNLAYLIYTSGSTGKPKGVMIEHRNAAIFIRWADTVFSAEELEAVLASTSLCFDLSVFELFVTLCRGGKVVVVPNALHVPSSQPITLINTVPSILAEMIRLHPLPPELRTINLAGEALPLSLAKALHEIAPQVRILNLYGPSEDTTYSTYYELPTELDCGPWIGNPIANTHAYVLDEFLQPVPEGVTGEIYLGGSGLARGYLGRPELTAERFLPNPFSRQPGGRMYKTGDRGRIHADGNLEYLGRVDGQIKLRGFRIELGEIEAVLGRQAGVRNVAVAVHQNKSGDPRLVAYVETLRRDGSLTVELREAVKQTLPSFMSPSAFVFLEALPLTVNGKVDRKALLALAPETVELARTVTAPRTPAEELMAGIWSEVLGVERVGIYDNFFELGGHSLLATRVLSRLRKLMQVDVPLHTLFEAPTVARFAEVVEARRWQDNGMAPPPLVRLPRDHANANTFVQSLAQQRLWFLDQLQPNRSTYNMFNAVRMEGDLDLSALEASLNELIRRHEILRTTFHKGDMSPVQVVAGELRISVPLVDLTGLPKDEQDPTVRSLAEAEAQRPFDLAQGPLLRMRVLRLAADEHVLFFAMHHIVSDGWSIGVLVQEMAALYPAFRAGEPSPLRDLDFQYADFSEWQRSWLSGEPLERQLTYWRNQLKAAPAFLPLPTDQNEAPTRSGAGSNVSRRFDKPLVDSIQRFTRAENVTPFMTLLAAFQALLYRYTNQTDILVGTPIADRRREEIEPLIGFFVNTLVMRADLTGNPSFRHLVARVRETALDAYAYQDVPFDRLVEELRPQRQAGMTPLFRVMFALQNAPLPHLALPGLHVTPIEFAGRSAQFDLTLEIVEDADGMIARFEFSTDLFDEATVQRMLEHYQQLLTGALAQPDQRLSDLPLLTAPEFDQLVYGFNELKRLPPPAEPIHALFEQQVDRTPDRIAAVDGYIQISYAELEARANRLAHYLIGCGVGPEMCVGICIPRSVSMIIAVLGVLKAGAAYLPLDPAYPAERLSFMLADGAVSVLLAERSVLNILPPHSARTVLIDTDWPSISICSASRPLSPVSPQNLAYLIYTSGSTGKPKGVAVTHAALVNHTCSAGVRFGLGSEDRVLQFASLSFDTSAEEIFPCLTHGATLVLRTDEMLSSPASFLEACGQWEITVLDLPTAYWHELAATVCSDGAAIPESLRLLIIGGEAASPEMVARWVGSSANRVRLVNTYGPTEATIVATTCDLSDEAPEHTGRAPIGQPIHNVQAYVVDPFLNPVPPGLPGEILLGGAGIARGYLNRPELTAEKFIPDPFSSTPGARLYRTGDLGRYLPGGVLEFKGRVDSQIKLRGFRIELGEIEAVLGRQAGVRNAAVALREEKSGHPHLVAYIETPRHDGSLTVELREAVRQTLPSFMAPSTFVFLDALPVTVNGKVDRAALPAFERQPHELELSSLPRNESESTMAKIWAEVLGYESIGIRDNFFELGGHSLLALRLQTKVRNSFGVGFPLSALFEHPTIEQLVEIVVGRSRESGQRTEESLLVPMQTGGAHPPLFLVHPIGGGVLCYAELTGQLGMEQTVYGIQAVKESLAQLNNDSIEQMAERYISAIRSVQKSGPFHLAGWSLGGVIAYAMAQQLQDQGQEIASLILLDSFISSETARPVSEREVLRDFADDVAAQAGKQLMQITDSGLDFQDELHRSLRELQRADALPADLAVDDFHQMWKVYRHNYGAWTGYKPRQYTGKIHLLMSSSSHALPESPAAVWKTLAAGGLDIEVIPGDHYSLILGEGVAATAKRVKAIYIPKKRGDQ